MTEESQPSTSQIKPANLKVGQAVTAYRKSKGMTQNELAGKAGISRSVVALVEQGRQHLSTNILALVATALGVEPAQLSDADPSTFPVVAPREQKVRKQRAPRKMPPRTEPQTMEQQQSVAGSEASPSAATSPATKPYTSNYTSMDEAEHPMHKHIWKADPIIGPNEERCRCGYWRCSKVENGVRCNNQQVGLKSGCELHFEEIEAAEKAAKDAPTSKKKNKTLA